MPYLTEGPKTAPENSWAQKHQGKLGLLSLTIPSLLRCSNSWLHVLISPLSKWLSILAKEVSSVSYSSNNVQKGRVSTACLIYLVTDNNVDTSRALSVNLVNLVERNIKHRGKFSSNFWGNHFFQVDCMINWKKKKERKNSTFTIMFALIYTWSIEATFSERQRNKIQT